jgi:hypothetical protein
MKRIVFIVAVLGAFALAPISSAFACSSDSNCKVGKCSGGKCGSCNSDSDCKGHSKCSGGKCGSCNSDSDCKGGKCSGGKCSNKDDFLKG